MDVPPLAFASVAILAVATFRNRLRRFDLLRRDGDESSIQMIEGLHVRDHAWHCSAKCTCSSSCADPA